MRARQRKAIGGGVGDERRCCCCCCWVGTGVPSSRLLIHQAGPKTKRPRQRQVRPKLLRGCPGQRASESGEKRPALSTMPPSRARYCLCLPKPRLARNKCSSARQTCYVRKPVCDWSISGTHLFIVHSPLLYALHVSVDPQDPLVYISLRSRLLK
jgi:hypothetical protein